MKEKGESTLKRKKKKEKRRKERRSNTHKKGVEREMYQRYQNGNRKRLKV